MGFNETPSPEQITEWRIAAQQDDAMAQYFLGGIYLLPINEDMA